MPDNMADPIKVKVTGDLNPQSRAFTRARKKLKRVMVKRIAPDQSKA